MKSTWKLVSHILQLVIGAAGIISYVIIGVSGAPMLKQVITLILAIVFFVEGVIGIIGWLKAKK